MSLNLQVALKRETFFRGEKVIPVNLLANNEARLVFEQTVLMMQRSRLNRYWIKQHFRGIRPPSTLASFDAALLFVKKVKGAIVYIPVDLVDNTVKVIYEY